MLLSVNNVYLNDNMVFGATDETSYIQTRIDYQKIGDLGVILSPLMTYLQVTLSMDDTYSQTTR